MQEGLRVKKPGWGNQIDRFLNSIAYPVVLALLCAFSGLGTKERYTACMAGIAIFVLLTVFFSKDNKALVPPMLMSFLALGQDEKHVLGPGEGDVIASYDSASFTFVIGLGVVAVAALLVRFWKDGTIKDIWKNPGLCAYGILALDGAFLLNGAFSPYWKPIDLLYGLLMAFGFTFFYFICVSIVRRSQNGGKYICQSMVCTGLLILVQIAVALWRLQQENPIDYELGIFLGGKRGALQLGWGIVSTISAFLVLSIPAAFYLASNYRYSAVSFLLGMVFFGATAILSTRSAILVGGCALIISIAVCCFGGNKRLCRRYTALTAVAGVGLLIVFELTGHGIFSLLQRLLTASRLDDIWDTVRISLWENGWKDFLQSPLFGVGFDKGAFLPEERLQNVYSNMYHNILVQFPAAMGIAGVAAFLLHIVQLFRLLLKKCTGKRLLILLTPLMILTMSLVDNYWFYLNHQIAYCIFLAWAEHSYFTDENLENTVST